MIHKTQGFVVALSRHRNFGNLLIPYFVEQIPGEPFLRILGKVMQHNLDTPTVQLSPVEIRIVKIAERYSDERLSRKFCPGKPVSEFQNLIKKEDVRLKVITYIEGALYEMLEILKAGTVEVYQKREKYTNLYTEDVITLSYQDTGAVFNFHRTEEETRYFLTLRNGQEHFSLLKKNVENLVTEPCRVFYQNIIYYFDHISFSKLLPFKEKEYITIPKKMEDKYFESFILNAVKSQEVIYSGFEIVETVPEKEALLTLEKDIYDEPVFVLNFKYNGIQLKMKEGERKVVVLNKVGDQYIFKAYSRDLLWEKVMLDFLLHLGLDGSAQGLKLKKEFLDSFEILVYQAVAWLSKHADHLVANGFKISQAGMDHSYFLGKFDLQISVDSKIDWFDLEMKVQIGEWSIPFVKFKKHISNGIREYKLPNGEVFVIPETWFSRYGEILSFGKAEGQNIHLNPFHFTLLDGGILPLDSGIQERVRKLSSQGIDYQDSPESLTAQLRHYQQDGYNWLVHLWQNGMNGCLADDMGLGKTIQTLVLLLKLKKTEEEDMFFFSEINGQLSLFNNPEKAKIVYQPASLIVLPVSLIHNWENEIKKFAPALRCYVYTGAKRHEKLDVEQLVRYYDIILTTYGTVRNDSEVLTRHTFYYLILDESQNIKNAESKSYQAVTSISSHHRLSLTGTPIENSLSDLWSQMNFLHPGILGSFSFFRENYLLPIEKDHNPEASLRLNRVIEPFILRRTKEQVAKDLPPVMEELLTIRMAPGQMELYESEKSAVRNHLLENFDDLQPRNTTFLVLQALTRLRQIAIHPKMIDPESQLESGKFNEIITMLEILVSENHKILIFSSFVKHLNLLGAACKEMNWEYCRLTGQTTDRKSVIDEFQTGNKKNIFLISLKAGGVGLNLTAADYIFIIDPWWNPAAEMQAISRAHRIGQDKKVFVYRFISENSIEEKIQLLQERKSALAGEFIKSSDPFSVVGKEELIHLFD